VLPVGRSNFLKQDTCKVFCPRCKQIMQPARKAAAIFADEWELDGAYFGTTFPHLLLMQQGGLEKMPPPLKLDAYVPRVFGFRIRSANAPPPVIKGSSSSVATGKRKTRSAAANGGGAGGTTGKKEQQSQQQQSSNKTTQKHQLALDAAAGLHKAAVTSSKGQKGSLDKAVAKHSAMNTARSADGKIQGTGGVSGAVGSSQRTV